MHRLLVRGGLRNWLCGREVALIDQPLPETPWHLGPVAPAAHGSVRPLAVPVSIAVTEPILCPMRSLWRGRLGFAGRFGPVPAALLAVATSLPVSIATRFPRPASRRISGARCRRRLGIVARRLVAMIVLGFHIGDVEKAIAPHREIDEGRLDGGFEIDNLSLVDVSGVTLVASTLDIQLFEDAILDDGDPALLGLQYIDQHFFFHALSFQDEREARFRVELVFGDRINPGLEP
jgi:hypothetical protein